MKTNGDLNRYRMAQEGVGAQDLFLNSDSYVLLPKKTDLRKFLRAAYDETTVSERAKDLDREKPEDWQIEAAIQTGEQRPLITYDDLRIREGNEKLTDAECEAIIQRETVKTEPLMKAKILFMNGRPVHIHVYQHEGRLYTDAVWHMHSDEDLANIIASAQP